LRDNGIEVAAISYDPPEVLAAFSRQRGITFPLLSDQGSATIRRFGLVNPVAEWAQGADKDDPAVIAEIQKYVSGGRPNASMIGMAFPGTFMLDPRGRVTSRFFEEYYVDRSTVASVMVRAGVGRPPVTATRISSPQIEVTTFASDDTVAPGNRISLVFDVVPKRGMHVYAPGASSYNVIGVNLDAQPFVQVLPMTYPASEAYTFKPLNETVPVYRKPFRLVQEIVMQGTREAQAALRGRTSLTLAGTLDYQACDDRLCYNPSSIPVSWTFNLRPLVVERPATPR
jgi:peroxiredoxin